MRCFSHIEITFRAFYYPKNEAGLWSALVHTHTQTLHHTRDQSKSACVPIGFYHHKHISLPPESDMRVSGAHQQCNTDYKLAQGHTHNCTLPSVGVHVYVYVCVCMHMHTQSGSRR